MAYKVVRNDTVRVTLLVRAERADDGNEGLVHDEIVVYIDEDNDLCIGTENDSVYFPIDVADELARAILDVVHGTAAAKEEEA